jgi:hypothetical protein
MKVDQVTRVTSTRQVTFDQCRHGFVSPTSGETNAQGIIGAIVAVTVIAIIAAGSWYRRQPSAA